MKLHKEANYYLGANFLKAPIYSNEELKKIIRHKKRRNAFIQKIFKNFKRY